MRISLIVAMFCVCAFASLSEAQCSGRQGLFARRHTVNVTVALPSSMMKQAAPKAVVPAAPVQQAASCASGSCSVQAQRTTIRTRIFHR